MEPRTYTDLAADILFAFVLTAPFGFAVIFLAIRFGLRGYNNER